MKKKILTVVVGMLVVLVVFSSGCIDNGSPFRDPKAIFVALDGTGNYTRIQDALDAAVDNDTIYVQPGSYDETLVINKSIRLIGAGNTTTIIFYDNQTTVPGEINIMYVTADHCEISGFSVIRSFITSVKVRGLYLGSSDNVVANNTFLNCSEGVFVYMSRNNTVSLNTFSGNEFGIALMSASNNLVTHNTFSSNTQYGLYTYSTSDSNVISRNIFVDNYEGVRIKGSKNNQVLENKIDSNSIGLQFCCGANYNTVYTNMFMKNEFHAKDLLNNSWDNGSVGNYWDDYTYKNPNATAVNGVWDTPYLVSITKTITDDFPLVKPLSN